ncbi:unnamed protein product [Blepharisma stoltei]|uniref:Uncharacterized protein n=1 Tax=Blepharisma stoltei TaxID=1481888 RepID=A0AAU9IVF8_9CILI|nr:unnamed protein product [Blepharisma stoltei]
MGSSPSCFPNRHQRPSFRCSRRLQRSDTNSSPGRRDMDRFKILSSALNGCKIHTNWKRELVNWANC